MKQGTVRCLAVLTILTTFSLSSAFASKKPGEAWFKGSTVDMIEQNLARALQTPSPGMQTSAAQVVRDLKTLMPDQEFPLLVIPLMAIVKNEDADLAARTVAALALHDLQTARGDFAIERVAQFAGNERMRHLCTWLTYERLQKNPPAAATTAALER